MDRFFDGLGELSSADKISPRNWTAPCELTEYEDRFNLTFDVPGMRQDDLSISLTERLLTVEGERRSKVATSEDHASSRPGQERSLIRERVYGSFKRSFTLPSNVNAEAIQARYQDGVLELTLPKAAKAQVRKIEIQAGSQV
jgi:HSP20 family protein